MNTLEKIQNYVEARKLLQTKIDLIIEYKESYPLLDKIYIQSNFCFIHVNTENPSLANINKLIKQLSLWEGSFIVCKYNANITLKFKFFEFEKVLMFKDNKILDEHLDLTTSCIDFDKGRLVISFKKDVCHPSVIDDIISEFKKLKIVDLQISLYTKRLFISLKEFEKNKVDEEISLIKLDCVSEPFSITKSGTKEFFYVKQSNGFYPIVHCKSVSYCILNTTLFIWMTSYKKEWIEMYIILNDIAFEGDIICDLLLINGHSHDRFMFSKKDVSMECPEWSSKSLASDPLLEKISLEFFKSHTDFLFNSVLGSNEILDFLEPKE